MLSNSLFANLTLRNRLGQDVHLDVCHSAHQGRDYVFVMAPAQHNARVIGKNAEHFALQLRETFAIDPRRFELIEVRDNEGVFQLFRWRFEWALNTPLAARPEEVSSTGLRTLLLDLILPPSAIPVAVTA